jgi:hypothetical protein
LPPKPTPNWRRLDWWLGNTPEQIEEVKQEAEAIKQAPTWVRVCLVIVLLLILAAVIAAKGLLVIIPTVGLIGIFGIHYLITGKVLSPPIPIWFHLVFWLLLLLTVFLAVGG